MSQNYNSINNYDDYFNPPSKRQNENNVSLPFSRQDEINLGDLKAKKSLYKRFINWLIAFVFGYIILFRLNIDVTSCDSDNVCSISHDNLITQLREKFSGVPKFPPIFKPKEYDSFDLLKPDYTSPSDENLVYTHNLMIEHEFGHSWGQVFTKKFYPSDVTSEFNAISMSLAISINGTQYDRLLNIFLNDIMVWRSSTIEPLNRKTTKSHVNKDISKYLSLFKEEEIELKFQLNNLIAGKLDGVFVVDLTINYYMNKFDDELENTANLTFFEKTLLNNLNPYSSPDVLKPLFKDQKKSSNVPLIYFPTTSKKNIPYKLQDLSIDHSTNKLAMELFISGNAAEEFWYSNVLDEYNKKFDDKGFTTLGHGPVRFLNVYLSSQYEKSKIFNSIPIPVVFTGGFAPSLWKPVVSIGCFDLKGIYIDLSPYLQFLRQDDYYLEFEVVSSNVDEFDKGIGSNWIISGNLMEWNNHDIDFKNKIRELPKTDEYIATADDGNDFLKQNVSSLSILNKEFEFEFEEKEYLLQVFSENMLVSNISLVDFGKEESSVLSIHFIKQYKVIEKENENIVFVGSDKTFYSFVEDLKSNDSEDEEIDSVYTTNAVTSYSRNVNLQNFVDDKEVSIFDISASQTGKAIYNISTSLGNHGSGSSVHSINIQRNWPIADIYSRNVIVKDNKVVIDFIED
ncbi:hypothetical protein QEN19_000207 [Hanseniaspora menglaensis]